MIELFCSFDIETDGPCPGINSMLSLGAVIFNQDGKELASVSANLTALPDAAQNPHTMKWWARHPVAWAHARRAPAPPEAAMESFLQMLQIAREQHGVPCTLLAYPAGFDFSFLYYYLHRFPVPGLPIELVGFNCIDIRSFLMGATGRDFAHTSKGYWTKKWDSKLPHTHIALDDAREQGVSFIKMLKESRSECE